MEYWYKNILNPDPVNLWSKIKHNAEFLLPKFCKSLESPSRTTNHFLFFFLSLALMLVFHSRNKNFTAGMYIALMMLWFRNATNRCQINLVRFELPLRPGYSVCFRRVCTFYLYPWFVKVRLSLDKWFHVFLRYPLMSINLKDVYCATGECTLKSVLNLVANLVALLFSSVNRDK